MLRMLNKIERKIGKYAIKNLIYYILGGYVIGYILLLTGSIPYSRGCRACHIWNGDLCRGPSRH